VHDQTRRLADVSADQFAAVEARERAELDRRARRLRGDRPREPLAGRVVVVVDDGIATGSTAAAACQVVRAAGAAWVVLAAPVAAPPVVDRLRGVADEVVCVDTATDFFAIGQFYRDFSQTSEELVLALLRRAGGAVSGDAAAAGSVPAGAGPSGNSAPGADDPRAFPTAGEHPDRGFIRAGGHQRGR
jgi:putative phosphoribosyl transferase